MKKYERKTGSKRTTKARLSKKLKTKKILKRRECAIKTSEMDSSPILGGKIVKNVQIDPQTTKIWPTSLRE